MYRTCQSCTVGTKLPRLSSPQSPSSHTFSTSHGTHPMNPWPALSPDLNPIEFILGDMKRAVAQTRPNSIPSLRLAIRTAWWRVVTPEYCATLYGAESTTLKLWSRIKRLVDVTLTLPQLFKLASLSHQLSIFVKLTISNFPILSHIFGEYCIFCIANILLYI